MPRELGRVYISVFQRLLERIEVFGFCERMRRGVDGARSGFFAVIVFP